MNEAKLLRQDGVVREYELLSRRLRGEAVTELQPGLGEADLAAGQLSTEDEKDRQHLVRYEHLDRHGDDAMLT